MAFILFVGGIVLGFGIGWLVWGSRVAELNSEVRRQISLRDEASANRHAEQVALSRAEERVAEIQSELVAASAKIAQSQAENWELRRSMALAKGAREEKPSEIDASLREQLAGARQALANERARYRAVEAELETVRAERDMEAGKVVDLREELAAATNTPDDAQPLDAAPRPSLAPQRRRIAEILKAAQVSAPSDSDTADDLTAINGIGPILSQKLREVGITTVRQIADLTPADVARVDAMLDVKGRIAREKWIEQARQILAPR